MGKQLRVAALMAAVVALGASAKRYQSFTPAQAPASDGALKRAQRALAERGESIATMDEASGLLLSEWREKLDEQGAGQRLRWKVTIDGGLATVDSQCEFRIYKPGAFGTGGPGEWESCGANQPQNRSDEAQAIANEIGR